MKRFTSIVLAVLLLCSLMSISAFAEGSVITPSTDSSSAIGTKFAGFIGSEFNPSNFFLADFDDTTPGNHVYNKTWVEVTTDATTPINLYMGVYYDNGEQSGFLDFYESTSAMKFDNTKTLRTVSNASPFKFEGWKTSGYDLGWFDGGGVIGVYINNPEALSSGTYLTMKVYATNPSTTGDPDQYDAGTVTYTFPVASTDPDVSGKFTLKKEFYGANGYVDGNNKIENITDRVITDATFVIEPYASYNREVGKTDIPAFAQSSYTIPVSGGTYSLDINTPNYYSAGVGDYWYTVTEQSFGKTAGVNVDETNPRYLHVQVIWDSTAPGGMSIASYALHSAAPNADGTYNNTAKGTEGSDKTDGFTNTYGAGVLKVTKEVSGNMGDPDKLFKVTVKFIHPDGKDVMSDISYNGYDANGNAVTGVIDHGLGWGTWGSSEQLVTVYLKNGATATFENIPAGVTYEVYEDDYSGEGYEVAYTGANTEDGDAASAAKFTGTITDSLDEVTITNTKTVAIDVGVILDNAPFILLLVGSMAFFAVYFVTKRRKEEETY